MPAEPLLLEAPAPVLPPVTPAQKPEPRAKAASTVKAKAAHTGRHAFRNGVCGRDACGAIDPRGATDQKHNPFMQQPATGGPAAVVAAAPTVIPGTSTTEAPIRYCVIQGCHEAIGLGNRCADGHVQGGRA